MAEHGTCLIVAGAPYYALADVPTADYVIACDLGYRHARALSLTPDLIVGDFDSYQGARPTDVPTVVLPVEKDDTDTGYAVRYAVEHGYRDIRVLYALGGRLDHTVANLQTATRAAEDGARVTLYGEGVRAFVFASGALRLEVTAGEWLSVLSLADRTTGVSVRGAHYTLENATLRSDYPLGVSNRAEGEVIVEITGEGVLAVMLSTAP